MNPLTGDSILPCGVVTYRVSIKSREPHPSTFFIGDNFPASLGTTFRAGTHQASVCFRNRCVYRWNDAVFSGELTIIQFRAEDSPYAHSTIRLKIGRKDWRRLHQGFTCKQPSKRLGSIGCSPPQAYARVDATVPSRGPVPFSIGSGSRPQ